MTIGIVVIRSIYHTLTVRIVPMGRTGRTGRIGRTGRTGRTGRFCVRIGM